MTSEHENRPSQQVLETVDLPDGFGPKSQGKVRDIWTLPNGNRLMATTDRQSAFDRMVCLTPGKGRQLNMLSAWWFKRLRGIVPNHMIEVPHPNVMICKECEPIPVEMIVRDYITGSTSTSLWKNYDEKTGLYDWLALPSNLRKNQRLEDLVFTPTTKAERGQHDEPIKPVEAAARFGEVYWKMQEVSKRLFRAASVTYREAGLILVDTKFEFGRDKDGNLTLIDEVFTPDSSRLWRADSYEGRFASGKEPESLDKEFLRLWLRAEGFSGDGEVPQVPEEITRQLAALYAEPYHRLTGANLSLVDSSSGAIEKAVLPYLKAA